MSVVNACLITLRRSQYLADCINDSRISRYASSRGINEQDAADACNTYYTTVTIVSIVLSTVLNIMNASISAGTERDSSFNINDVNPLARFHIQIDTVYVTSSSYSG